MSAVPAIARHELRRLARDRTGLAALLLFLLLLATATLVAWQRHGQLAADRARHAAETERQWDAQPDRHPHRVIHFGTFVFQPLGPLAFFDFGTVPFTGHSLYLEGHRQNTANFGEARQNSLLLRFGILSPALVLQAVAPLLMIFLAFGSLAGERERGTLALLRAQGLGGGTILAGKLLGQAAVIPVMLVPLALALPFAGGGALPAGLALLAVHALYLLLWTAGAVLVSALARRSRDALLVLVACWAAIVVVVPRLAPTAASWAAPAPSRIEAELALDSDLRRVGDSHDPDDPAFAAFRDGVLRQYGVARVEDLPVNFGGLVSLEGERLTTEVLVRHMEARLAHEARQNRLKDRFAWASPLVAVRRLSLSLSGTGPEAHAVFLRAAEAHRFALVQALNHLHVEKVRRENDRDQRLHHSHWQALPAFTPMPPAPAFGRAEAMASLALAAWLVVLAALMARAARHVAEEGR